MRSVDGGVLVVDALPTERPDQADLAVDTLPMAFSLLQRRGRPEQVLLTEGPRHIRLLVRSGTVRTGFVRLRIVLCGLADLEHQLLTLRQLAALSRSGRLSPSLARPDPRAEQWTGLLRVHDGFAAGASQREIAECLFGTEWVARGWKGESDFLRSRLRRMVHIQRRMIDGAYRTLLI